MLRLKSKVDYAGKITVSKSKTKVMLCLLTLIASMFVVVPITLSSPETYGPRLDEILGRFVESPAAQLPMLYGGEVDYWPDIRDPQIITELQDEGYTVVATPETFLYYHIDFNVRDQLNPSGDGDPWRTAWASEVDRVILEGYTNGPYDEDVDFDIYTRYFNWLGSLYGTGTGPNWVTPRWIGNLNASDMEPSLKTAAGINDLELLVFFYDPAGHGGPGNILDCLRLKVEFKDDRAPEYLYVDGFDATRVEWTAVGASPYLDAPGDGSYIEGTTDGAWMCLFSFQNIDLGGYYTYSGAPYTNYVPLDDQAFRHAIAHLIPKDQIVTVVYGGIAGAAIDSLVPPAQKAWHNPNVDGHPHSPPEAISILETAGYVYVADAPNPVAGVVGNWLDPHTGDPMNHITFAGVTQAIAPDSWARDDMCVSEFQAIGLPIEHVEVDYGYLTDTMMNNHQFDMYAAGWKISRFPDHLYGFFHSSQDMIEGYNIPGIHDATLDALLEMVQYDMNLFVVKEACFDAQDRLAELCISLPTITRPAVVASAAAGAPGHTDTLKGIVNSSGYGPTNDWTFYDLHWASNVDPVNNPLGIGGTARFIIPSEPTNYHPGYASTTDEWLVLSRIFDPLIQVNPYTHEDIPWIAYDWEVDATYEDPISGKGMNITFWLRDDVYYHDGEKFNASMAKWSLEFARDQQIARAFPMWQHLVHIEVHDTYTFSVYHNATSPWILPHLAGPDLWLINDAACWATMFPKHCYEGTDRNFRPEATVNPHNPLLTCLVGTGPFVFRGGDLILGGYVSLTAFRSPASPVGSFHWWMSTEEEAQLLAVMFHWIGDVNYDGIIDTLDLARVEAAYGSVVGDPNYDEHADIAPEPTYHTNDGYINLFDLAEVIKNWGKSWKYPYQPEPPPPTRTIDKTLSTQEGYLGDVVHVKLEVTVPTGETVEVMDTLPSEWSYINGTFSVDGVPTTPTITKNSPPPPIITEISYTITEPGTYMIEFDVKVDSAYWEDREVCNVATATWYDEEGNVIETKEDVECFTIHAFEELHKNVGIPKADVVFAIDLTGSMWDEIAEVKANATYIMNTLAAQIADVQFGLISFMDYDGYYTTYAPGSVPVWYNATYGSAASGDYPYNLDQDITNNIALMTTKINGLTIGWGADGPQDYTRIIHESWNDTNLHWRDGAKRILILFGDDVPHDTDFDNDNDSTLENTGGDPGRDTNLGTSDDLDFETEVANAAAAGVHVMAVYSGWAGEKFPWTYMASQTGGGYFELTEAEQIPDAIRDLIKKQAEETLTIKEKTEVQWAVVMDVTNPFGYTMKNVNITDNFGAELEVDEAMTWPDTNNDGVIDIFDLARVGSNYGTVALDDQDQWDPVSDISGDGLVDMRDLAVVARSYGLTLWLTGKTDKVHLFWYIGDLEPGETARIIILVSTDLNPAGQQEYSEPGIYEMNSGATLRFIDPEQDMQLSAVTDSIYVTVLPLEDP